MLNLPTLSSNGVTLEPLTLNHAKDLTAACQDGELWSITTTSVPEPSMVINYINNAHITPDRCAFAVIDDTTGKAIGSTSYHDILPLSRRLEIGYTWYAKSYWRTHVNAACKLMMLTYAFETLEYLTVGWRTDAENYRSQQAIERLGVSKDGTIRGNRVCRDGTISSTVMYSLTASEWPDIKANLKNRLNEVR